MLCLSVVMIAITLIRLIGTIVNTKSDGHGSAPTWYTYWAAAERCIVLMTTTVIVVRAVFITKTLREHRRMDDSIWSRASRRLLSTLQLVGSSGGSGHTAPRKSDEEHAHDPKAPRITTKASTRATLTSAGNFVSSECQRSIGTEDILKQGGYSYRARRSRLLHPPRS
ncbi:hypothetical protein F5X98DRAFT_261214 [Xylaria grammica]|nr:hypothetical protein F5X98DRAFT_261214 [Xylaria grammica]